MIFTRIQTGNPLTEGEWGGPKGPFFVRVLRHGFLIIWGRLPKKTNGEDKRGTGDEDRCGPRGIIIYLYRYKARLGNTLHPPRPVATAYQLRFLSGRREFRRGGPPWHSQFQAAGRRTKCNSECLFSPGAGGANSKPTENTNAIVAEKGGPWTKKTSPGSGWCTGWGHGPVPKQKEGAGTRRLESPGGAVFNTGSLRGGDPRPMGRPTRPQKPQLELGGPGIFREKS